MIVDFSALHSKLLLNGLVTQTVLPFNDETEKLRKDCVCPLSFEGMVFNDYSLKVVNVTVTSLNRLSNKDISNNGFLYRPFFMDYMEGKGIGEGDTIIKMDFELIGCD